MPTTISNPNFFAGSPLNRLSWLRPSHAFLNALVLSPETRWIIFNAGQPLVVTNGSVKQPQLAYLPTSDVLSILGPEPFFGQAEEEGKLVPTSAKALGSIRHRGARLVFLGVQEHLAGERASGDRSRASSSSSPDVKMFEDVPEQAVATLNGTPFFCVDVAEVDQAAIDVVFSLAVEKGEVLSWMDARAVMACLDAVAAGVYAQARSMVDWNQRNKVCRSNFAFFSQTYNMGSSVLLVVRRRTQCGVAGKFPVRVSCLGLIERAGYRVQPSSLLMLSVSCEY
jgi:NAD+ diphosphatase